MRSPSLPPLSLLRLSSLPFPISACLQLRPPCPSFSPKPCAGPCEQESSLCSAARVNLTECGPSSPHQQPYVLQVLLVDLDEQGSCFLLLQQQPGNVHHVSQGPAGLEAFPLGAVVAPGTRGQEGWLRPPPSRG